MKYSNFIGVWAAVALIIFCFVPWVYIDAIKATITGFRTARTNFGLPGVAHIFLCVIAIIFYLLPRVWAKRTNLFVCTFNVAWAARNFLLITQCELGECPEKKFGIYGILVCALIMLVMSMLPRLNLQTTHPDGTV